MKTQVTSQLLSSCELHIHLAGSFYAEDFCEIGRDLYQDVNWHGQNFLAEYRERIDSNFDPVKLFAEAICDPVHGMARLKAAYVFDDDDEADFARFMSKYRFFSRVWGHVWEKQRRRSAADMINGVIDHHKRQGLNYVEYRSGFWGTAEEQMERMRICIETLKAASDDKFTARYISPIPRNQSEEIAIAHWGAVELLAEHYPELAQTFVGVDFASIEEGNPPKNHWPILHRLQALNRKHSHLKLEVVYHVGESFYDKSIESGIRWCHEAALLGAKRLGHCIALGLDPAIAITRRPQAHEAELVSERLDQIRYDLSYSAQLLNYGVTVDRQKMLAEQTDLVKLDPNDRVERPYSPSRLQEIRGRQQFVLDQLINMGTVIESCPTSNLRIGGVPDKAHHPVFSFLRSDVNLAICADDPGIFDITLADEIDWIVRNSDWKLDGLEMRLGDPRRFRLGQLGASP